MSLVMPISQVSSWFAFSTELEGVTYGFEFRWNDRMQEWIMAISDGEENLLAAGISCVINAPLLFGLHHLPGVPPGEFIVLDSQGLDEDPGLEDLGRRCPMIYLLSTELG